MYIVDIFFTYAVQFYVVMDIVGPNLVRPAVSERMYPYAEHGMRILVNIFTRESELQRLVNSALFNFSRTSSYSAMAGPPRVSGGNQINK